MSIYDRKYQIFVSSTYLDLVKAREEVIKVILSLFQIPIGMEMFSADNEEQWSIIQTTIENSDYYLLILGHRYGSLTKEEISYTEKEFDYAKSLNIPIIAFVKNRDIATTPNERDDDFAKKEKLEAFLLKVTSNAMCDFWNNENELGQKVAIAFTKLFFKTPRIGWVRANNSGSIEELAKLIQENRDLRDELESIKAKSSNELPSIIVTPNEEIFHLAFNKKPHVSYNQLDFKSIPDDLVGFITEDEVDAYNKEVKEKEFEIELFREKYDIYHNFKYNSKELVIEIMNDGKRKANDVFVDIEFPDEICLMEKEDLEDLEIPKKPKLSENPLNKALKNRQKLNDEVFGKSLYSIHNAMPVINTKLYRSLNLNRKYRIDKENNSLHIRLVSLMQTRKSVIKDDIIIAAKMKGVFKVNVNVICDEYTLNQRYSFDIKVE